jgi:3-carboxy-cis,cis-muconate cycloisomerase
MTGNGTAVIIHPGWLAGLFGDPEAEEIWSSSRQLRHMLAFEAAYTRALGRTGMATPDVAERIGNLIENFEPDLDDLRNGTARDGVPVPALVRQLRQASGGDGASVHTGATSQDVVDTALAMTLSAFNQLVKLRLSALSLSLDDLSERFGGNAMTGRTRMQAALPITVADRLQTWVQPLRDHTERLERLRPSVEVLQLGGAVGDRRALAPHADEIAAFMAQMLGLGDPPNAWHTQRSNITGYANLLSMITGSLGKIGQDICLMAQQGIDEITLSGGGSSSAMAHKNNPVLAELLVTLARYNATQVSAMHHAMVHEQERSGAAWMLEWMTLPPMALAAARSLSAADALCRQITNLGIVTRTGQPEYPS